MRGNAPVITAQMEKTISTPSLIGAVYGMKSFPTKNSRIPIASPTVTRSLIKKPNPRKIFTLALGIFKSPNTIIAEKKKRKSLDLPGVAALKRIYGQLILAFIPTPVYKWLHLKKIARSSKKVENE